MPRFKKRDWILMLFAALIGAGKGQGSENLQEKEVAQESRTYTRYGDFSDISADDYIKVCMPKLTPEQQEQAAKIYNILLGSSQTPINEGHGDSLDNFGKILTEGGYSFPPKMQLQGPFLHYCGTGNFKRVLDIGAGHGADTIPLLLTHTAQVIADDIHQPQLEELKQKVTQLLSNSFPKLVKSPYFATLKRDFSNEETGVPPKYISAFDVVNLSRVLHFLNSQQTRTMIHNIASMMKEGGLLSITVSTFAVDSKEERWINLQKSQGLEDPGLVYYDTIKRLRRHPILGKRDAAQPGEITQVDRRKCKLPDPGHKIEFAKATKPVNSIPAVLTTLRQGRHFHTLESLKPRAVQFSRDMIKCS